MKKRVLLAGLLVVASASSVMAAGPYVGASGGVSILHDNDIKVTGVGTATASYDTGYGFNLSGGYNFDVIRVEGEFGYKNADMDKISGPGGSVNANDTDITLMSFMANAYYDIKTNSPITPFIGAGLGVLNGEIEVEGSNEDDTVFGYQVTAGVSYSVTKNVNLDLSYRFQGAGSDFSKNDVSIAYTSSNVLAGVRYTF